MSTEASRKGRLRHRHAADGLNLLDTYIAPAAGVQERCSAELRELAVSLAGAPSGLNRRGGAGGISDYIQPEVRYSTGNFTVLLWLC